MKYIGDEAKLIYSIYAHYSFTTDKCTYLFYEKKEDAQKICDQKNEQLPKDSMCKFIVKPLAIYTCLKEIKK